MSGNVHGLGIIINPIPLQSDSDAKPDPPRTKLFVNV